MMRSQCEEHRVSSFNRGRREHSKPSHCAAHINISLRLSFLSQAQSSPELDLSYFRNGVLFSSGIGSLSVGQLFG